MNVNSSEFLPSQEVGQARLVPSYIQNQCQCELCAQEYDLVERVPMMICPDQHTCCLICIRQIVLRKKKCPFCRTDIDINKVKKNRMICKILEEVAKRKGIKPLINPHPQKSFLSNALQPQSKPQIRQQIIIHAQDAQNGQAPLLELIPEVPRRSCLSQFFQRIQLKQPLFCMSYFLILFYCLPFFICELYYAYQENDMECLDKVYGVGISMRAWLLISGYVGASLYGLILVTMLMKACTPKVKKCSQVVCVFSLVVFFLKFLGLNIYGIVIFESIDDSDRQSCDKSLISYMTALFIIQLVIVCGICSQTDRR